MLFVLLCYPLYVASPPRKWRICYRIILVVLVAQVAHSLVLAARQILYSTFENPVIFAVHARFPVFHQQFT